MRLLHKNTSKINYKGYLNMMLVFYCSNVAARPAEIKEGKAASVRWAYAFRGLPGPPSETVPLRLVQCQAGGRLEEPLEVRLTGGRGAAGQEGGGACGPRVL